MFLWIKPMYIIKVLRSPLDVKNSLLAKKKKRRATGMEQLLETPSKEKSGLIFLIIIKNGRFTPRL